MTNLERVIRNNGDEIIEMIAKNFCFDDFLHIVKCVQPPCCGSCRFHCTNNHLKCDTEDIKLWLMEECEEDNDTHKDSDIRNKTIDECINTIDDEYYDAGYGTYHDVEMVVRMLKNLKEQK